MVKVLWARTWTEGGLNFHRYWQKTFRCPDLTRMLPLRPLNWNHCELGELSELADPKRILCSDSLWQLMFHGVLTSMFVLKPQEPWQFGWSKQAITLSSMFHHGGCHAKRFDISTCAFWILWIWYCSRLSATLWPKAFRVNYLLEFDDVFVSECLVDHVGHRKKLITAPPRRFRPVEVSN